MAKKKADDEIVLTAEQKEEELGLLRTLHVNSEKLEKHAEKRRDMLAKLKEEKFGIMESNRETNAALNALYNPPPLQKFANKKQAEEEAAEK